MLASKCSVAIVGAGISGALVASGLVQKGCDVSLFDKSRGTGGRLASARIGGETMDLGAPVFSAQQRSEFLALAPHLEPILQLWNVRIADMSNLSIQEKEPLYVPQGRSSALTRHLVEGAKLKTSTRVGEIEFMPDGRWALMDDQGDSLGTYDRVVLAVPAPQAVPLLKARPVLREWAGQVRLRPLWVTLLELNQSPERLVNIDWLTGGHPLLSRLVRDSSKPGRSGERWFLQAREDWSVEQVDQTAEQVAADMIEAFEDVCGHTPAPEACRTHRWLYALPDGEIGPAPQYDGLYVCGDWTSPQAGEGLSRACHSAKQLLQQWDRLAC